MLDLLSDWAILNRTGQYSPDTLHLLRRNVDVQFVLFSRCLEE